MLRAADSIWKTDTGRARADNEDSAYARPPLYVVADGMGGAQAGEVASALAVEEFRGGLIAQGTAEQRLSERVQAANWRIYETAHRKLEHEGMGTTLTAVYLDESNLAVAHVGDSRAYIFRDSELVRLTHDHSLVEELIRRGKLTPEQAAAHPQRSIITRALGIEPEVEVDTWTYPMRAGDVVLLCSDGLTSMISEPQIASVLAAEPDLERAGDRLITEANEAGGRDNITVVLFRLEDLDAEPGAPPLTEEATAVDLQPVSPQRDVDGQTGTNGGGGGDQVTRVHEAASAGPASASGPSVPAPPAPGNAPQTARAPRLARTQGPPRPVRQERGRSLKFKLTAALTSLVIVLLLVGGGGYLATRQLYFVGTNADGLVTLYNGLPYDFLGVPFWEQSYVSGLPASLIGAKQRAQLLNHNLRSQKDSIALIRAAELGDLPR
jgi:serine/threonine protein phosphatase PrpC